MRQEAERSLVTLEDVGSGETITFSSDYIRGWRRRPAWMWLNGVVRTTASGLELAPLDVEPSPLPPAHRRMRKKPVRVGSSLAIILDKPILDLLGIDRATTLELTTDGLSLRLRPMF